jgi:hypothetical protein
MPASNAMLDNGRDDAICDGMKTLHATLAVVIGLGLVSGCDDEDTAPETVTPKSAPADPGNVPQPAAAPTPATGPTSDAAARQSAVGISWEMPAGWSRGADAPMRLATVTDGTAEIAVSSFGGDVGGVLLNVNRWRAQVGLPPVESQADAEREVTEVQIASGQKVRVYDFAGPEKRTRVASVPGEGKLYFIKMTAASALVAERVEAFDKMVKSLRVE